MDNTIRKAGQVAALEVTEVELELINQQSLRPLSAQDVYTFKVNMCDNQVDRDNERFSDQALADLAKLFLGRTVISDHMWSSGGQIARIYATEIVEDGAIKRLTAHCYILRTESNADLIAEIDGGIKREVSVGCQTNKKICSICALDGRSSECPHYPGRQYDDKDCHFILDEAVDAYELSFVAVPSQREAGVTKQLVKQPPAAPKVDTENSLLQTMRAFFGLPTNKEET